MVMTQQSLRMWSTLKVSWVRRCSRNSFTTAVKFSVPYSFNLKCFGGYNLTFLFNDLRTLFMNMNTSSFLNHDLNMLPGA